MKIFNYDPNSKTLTLNQPEILTIKEFKEVFEDDKSKDKSKAFKRFVYAYLTTDWKSPYLFFPESEKFEMALEDSGLEKKEIESDNKLQALLEKYKKLMDSNIVVQQINAANTLLEKIAAYSKTVDLTETIESGPQKGKLVHSIKDARDTIEKMPKLIMQAREIRKLLDEELEEQNQKFRKNNTVGTMNELELQHYK